LSIEEEPRVGSESIRIPIPNTQTPINEMEVRELKVSEAAGGHGKGKIRFK
jgi:hypothetical protein